MKQHKPKDDVTKIIREAIFYDDDVHDVQSQPKEHREQQLERQQAKNTQMCETPGGRGGGGASFLCYQQQSNVWLVWLEPKRSPAVCVVGKVALYFFESSVVQDVTAQRGNIRTVSSSGQTEIFSQEKEQKPNLMIVSAETLWGGGDPNFTSTHLLQLCSRYLYVILLTGGGRDER